MTRTIFISHSCKDHEESPPEGLSGDEIERRAARLAFARKLRDRLDERLREPAPAGGAAFDVFLDQRELGGGQVWRTTLHRALRTCSGGVVLLTPESLASGWVLKEATILSWRAFDGEVVLVPVLLAVGPEELSARGFDALDLDHVQAVIVSGTGEGDISDATEEIVAALAKISPDPLDRVERLPPTERWIDGFADLLRGLCVGALEADNLVRMFEALDIPPGERATLDDDPYVGLAREALVASGNQIVRMLNSAGQPDATAREALRERVAMMWVEATPASRLLLAARGGRLIAIDATELRTLREYVLRACCNDIDADRIVETPKTSGSDQAIIDAVVDAVGDLHPIEDQAALAADVAEHGPIFVLLRPGSVRPGVLSAVTRDHPSLTFVAAAGPEPAKTLRELLTSSVLLRPELHPGRTKVRTRYQNKLAEFVKGKAAM